MEIDAPVAEADRGMLDALCSGMTRVDAQPDGAAA